MVLAFNYLLDELILVILPDYVVANFAADGRGLEGLRLQRIRFPKEEQHLLGPLLLKILDRKS